MTKQELINGQEFEFDNESFCERHQVDDVHAGWIMFQPRTQHFLIWFNGTIIFSSKSLSVTKKRLDKLFTKWSLEFIESEI
jgi:hypothetical protein